MKRLAIAVVLLSLLIGGGIVHAAKTRIRWDLTNITGGISAGGKASALARDGSKITVTGSGTFRAAGKSQDVGGGGNWETFDKDGKSTGSGAYQVTGRIQWVEAPGALPAALVDNIGDKANARGGLAILSISYSDGSEGILVVSCHLPTGAPDTIFEGITATKEFVDFFNAQADAPGVEGNRTIFHVVPPGATE